MEGPKVPSEARSAGAPRGMGSKNQRWNCTFSFGFSNVWRVTPVAKQPSVCNSGAKFFQSMTGGHSPMSPLWLRPWKYTTNKHRTRLGDRSFSVAEQFTSWVACVSQTSR